MAVYLGSNEVDILGGQTTSVTVSSLNVTSNGTYTAPSGTAYSPVSVAVSPNLTTKSITQNGTYAASSDSVDGYSSVSVNVAGSSFTKIYENTYTINTTSTTSTVTAYISIDNLTSLVPNIYTNNLGIYIRIRDQAGKRNGYFYGTDTFCTRTDYQGEGGAYQYFGMPIGYSYVSGTGTSPYYVAFAGGGVYPADIYLYPSANNMMYIDIYQQYKNFTINGTFKVEVFVFTSPEGGNIY